MASLRFAFSILAALSVSMTCAAQSPVIDTISPDSVIYKPVPQPTITITGSNLVVGLPSQINRPTLTITHTDLPGVAFSAMMSVNFSGTQATLPAGDNAFNMLQMPLGVYDLTLSRPDKESVTIPGGFSIITEPDPAPGSIEMRVASYWGGPITGMDLSPDGSLAYIANGRMLRILDLSDESNPTELGSIYLTGVNDVKVRDGYAFVGASSPHRFCVVDITDPANPELVWKAYAGGSTNRQVELRGEYAYVADLSSGGSIIHVWHITDPLNVVHAGQINGANAGAFTIADDRLYVGRDAISHHLSIYDLAANPVNPPLLGTLEAEPGTEGRALAMAVQGDYAYMTAANHDYNGPAYSIRTIDVSNPTSPLAVDSIDLDFSYLMDVAIANGYLYVVEGAAIPSGNNIHRGVLVYDISANPAAPSFLYNYKTHGNVVGIHVSQNRAYLRDDAEGLIILDITDPMQPARLGNFHSPRFVGRMAKVGDLLYVVDGFGGFTVLDVADSSQPVVVGVYLVNRTPDLAHVGGWPWDIAIESGKAYLSAGHLGLEVVDIMNPANPVFLGAMRITPTAPYGPPGANPLCSYFAAVDVKNSVAYVGYFWSSCTGNTSRLLTFDVSDPANIVPIGEVSTGGFYPTVAIAHNNLHGAVHVARASRTGHTEGMNMTIDIAGPTAPTIIHEGSATDNPIVRARDVALINANTVAIVRADAVPTSELTGLFIQDVSDPANPIVISAIESGPGYAVAAQNDRVYTVGLGSFDRLNVHDVSDPSQPNLLATVSNVGGGNSRSVLVDEPAAYVTSFNYGNSATAKAGLQILNIQGLPEAEPDCLADIVSSATFQPPPDGVVDGADLAYLLGEWGRNKGSLADIVTSATFQPPPDGIVDGADLAFLLGAWGGCE